MQEIIAVAVFMILGLGIYWTMVVMPRQRDFQKRQQYVRNLQVGDEVVTYGGLIGKIVNIEAEKGIAYVEVADGIVVRFITAALMQTYDPEEIAKNAQIGLKVQDRTEQREIPLDESRGKER